MSSTLKKKSFSNNIEKIFNIRLNQNLRIVAIGDSSVYGVGDIGEDTNDQGFGWAGRFAHDLNAKRFINLGTNGARASEVEKNQLPGALAMHPDLALICVGGNDALRNNFDPLKVAISLLKIVQEFEKIGTYVVLVALHDPSKITPAPKVIKKVLMERVLQINAAIRWVGTKSDAFIIETINRDNVYDKINWHIDRMHPSPIGHQLIADIVRRELSLPRRSKVKLPITSEASKISRSFWLITNALKWLGRRSIDLFPALMYLIIKEVLKSGSKSKEYAIRLKVFMEYVLEELFEEKLRAFKEQFNNESEKEYLLEHVWFTQKNA
ncbi:MAG: hypothetical protein RLZZ37_1214 [Actinomycetota bacterium]|jgi:lysophospholipase L1-like esterase